MILCCCQVERSKCSEIFFLIAFSSNGLPDGHIDGPGRAPEIGPAVLFGHGFYEHSYDRGVALEVAGPSIAETDQ